MVDKKKKIKFPKFILILNGPSCAGKTTVRREFTSKYGRIFAPKGDVIKWMISDYEGSKDRAKVVNMVGGLIEGAIKEGFSVVHDWSITDIQRVELKSLAVKYKLAFIEVNIEADFETISDRFDVRIEEARNGAKISMTDPFVMRGFYDEYMKSKDNSLPTFDSRKDSAEQIVKKIISLIRSS
ncbi:MAG: hypothetical protein PF542_02585 [Nanoarchaeota archaeon]|jgi:adenylylsulfate kinase-like enzyme|nr:hypothetical protein [Nanoarchaeota archaeon]